MTDYPRFRAFDHMRDDGQFYVWDSKTSGICNPDTGRCDAPWRKMFSHEEALAAAANLNRLEADVILADLCRTARRAWLDEEDLV